MNPQQIGYMQDLMIGFAKSQTLFSALELGIFQALATGPKTVEDLAKQCRFPLASGKKLLTASVALGLLQKNDNLYANAPASEELLVSGKPFYMGDFALHIYRTLYPLWHKLTDAVQENSTRWQQVTGSEQSHFANLYRDPEKLAKFMATMNMFSLPVAHELAQHFDFSGYSSLLDVGGGSGILGQVLLQKYPQLRIGLFDLPPVCQVAAQIIEQQYHQQDKIQLYPGNFLEDSLPGGFDIIYLGWVLHDWPEAVQRKILAKCYQALPAGGTVLATEVMLNEDESGPLFGALLSLDMLVSTGGGEKTANGYIRLFQEQGFREVRMHDLPGMRDLIIGKKP